MVYKIRVTEFISEDFYVNAESPEDATLFIAERYNKQELLVDKDTAFSVRYDAFECDDPGIETDFDISIADVCKDVIE